MHSPFEELALVLGLASALGIIAHLFRQPTMLAYIVTGLIVGPLGFLNLGNTENIQLMGQIGVTLLLFLIGLEMRVDEVKRIGRAALVTGIGQIVFTTIIGFFLIRLLGFASIESLFIAVALTFSSTIMVVKMLSEKKEMQTLHGQITVGFLLVQDFVAMVLLIMLAGLRGGESISFAVFFGTLAKAFGLFFVVWFAGKTIMPKLVARLAKSTELLFVFSIAWAFIVSYIVSLPWLGLSIEIGGFLAGLSLAASSQHFQINAHIRPLRDFFVILFFVVLGSSLAIKGYSDIIAPAGVLTLFVLVGNPLIVLLLMGFLGYRKRTGFLSSLAVAQVSEFSLILMAVGVRMGYVGSGAVGVVTFVAVATIMVSSYIIMHGQRLYEILEPILGLFERKHVKNQRVHNTSYSNHMILVGADRLGQHILSHLPKDQVIVVDYNPVVVEKLRAEGVNCYYGDIIDTDIQDLVDMDKAKLIISTIPDTNGNIRLLHSLTHIPKSHRPHMICSSYNEWEARDLYAAGADYVLLPHFIGGHQLGAALTTANSLDQLRVWRERDLATLHA